ncbi:MAG: hypothetical protein R2862_11575 [Thermoanaerobaculia bacterium]
MGFGGLAAAIASAQKPLGQGEFDFAGKSSVSGQLPWQASVMGFHEDNFNGVVRTVGEFYAFVGENRQVRRPNCRGFWAPNQLQGRRIEGSIGECSRSPDTRI